jgi:hypothetical protein
MSSVDALDTTITPAAQPAPAAEEVSLDTELDNIWDKAFVTNGADRGADGKFTSTNTESAAAAEDPTSLEGEKGEGQPGSTPADVPLPPNWQGKEDIWTAIPAEQRAAIAAHQQELHGRMSELGRKVATYQPLEEAAAEFAEYFNGNLRGSDGQPINPADGVRYLANIQRAMDRDPFSTLISIADTYGLREQLAQAFGGQVQAVAPDAKVLLNEIAGLKQTISGMQDPANIEQVIERRELFGELSRFASTKPLYAQVENDLPFYIHKAKAQLGQDAGRAAVLDKAYDLAVQADPALRAQSEAAQRAAKPDAAKAEAAKRAIGVNVTSTSTGKAKAPSLDDELSAIWDRSRKA